MISIIVKFRYFSLFLLFPSCSFLLSSSFFLSLLILNIQARIIKMTFKLYHKSVPFISAPLTISKAFIIPSSCYQLYFIISSFQYLFLVYYNNNLSIQFPQWHFEYIRHCTLLPKYLCCLFLVFKIQSKCFMLMNRYLICSLPFFLSCTHIIRALVT